MLDVMFGKNVVAFALRPIFVCTKALAYVFSTASIPEIASVSNERLVSRPADAPDGMFEHAFKLWRHAADLMHMGDRKVTPFETARRVK